MSQLISGRKTLAQSPRQQENPGCQYVRIASLEDHTKGKGLFAEKRFSLGETICQIREPLISSLDTARLYDTCYHCHGQHQAGSDPDVKSPGGLTGPETNAFTLRACTGCKVARYCGRICQKSSWASGHKLECKTFGTVYPRIMPDYMRVVVRLSMMKDKGLITQGQWDDFQQCPSHIEQFTSQRNDDLLKLVQMSQATCAYVKYDPKTVLQMYCRLKINSITLMTSWFDPLGLCFDPLLAKMNHSCHPNAFVFFTTQQNQSPSIKVMPLRPIRKDEEITISYVDENKPFKLRQKELKERYFFQCSCEKCLYDQNHMLGTLDHSLTPIYQSILAEAERHISSASSPSAEDSSPTSDLSAAQQHCFAALQILTKHNWPKHLYPYPQTLQKLIVSLIDEQQFDRAMLWALIQTIDIDPLVYDARNKTLTSTNKEEQEQNQDKSQGLHPIRIVHLYALIRLMNVVIDDTFSQKQPHSTISKSRPDFRNVVDDLLWCRGHFAKRLLDFAGRLYSHGSPLDQIRGEVYPILGISGGTSVSDSGFSDNDEEGGKETLAKMGGLRKMMDAEYEGLLRGSEP